MKKRKEKEINFWILAGIFIVVLFLYYKFLFVYFTGDDFFHFKVAQTDGGLLNFIKLFGVYPFEERGIAFYRPIFREGLYNIYYSLSGLNQIPFRVTQLLIHFINISLVYKFFNDFFQKRHLSIFVAFFYAITAAQVGSLYYLAGGIQAQGATMFMMLSLIYWRKSKVSSFIFFLLALMSHELAVVTPVLLAGLEIVEKNKLKLLEDIWKIGGEMINKLWPFAALTAFYLYLNFYVIGFSESEAQYQPVFNIGRTVNTLMWYSGWALGLPEMLVDFVGSGFSLNPNLMRYWGQYFRIIFLTFLGVAVLIVGVVVYLLTRARQVFNDKKFWFLAFWFPLALLPIIFLPLHKKTYYLATALPAFWGAVGYLIFSFVESLRKNIGGLLLLALVILLIVLNTSSIRISDETYWAAKRGRLAEKLIVDITTQYPELPKGATIYVKNDPNYPNISGDWGGSSTQANFILNGSDALQLAYDDFELSVEYEDLESLLDENSGYLRYQFIARLD